MGRERRMVDLCHLWISGEVVHDLECIFYVTLHAEAESLDSLEEYPCIERRDCGSGVAEYDGAEKLNRGFLVFCSVKLKQMNKDIAKHFVEVIKNIPQVSECYNIAGEYDYLLKINAPDMKSYNDFLINNLGTVDSIGSILSTFVMDEIKHDYGFNI